MFNRTSNWSWPRTTCIRCYNLQRRSATSLQPSPLTTSLGRRPALFRLTRHARGKTVSILHKVFSGFSFLYFLTSCSCAETGPMGRTLAAHDFPQIDHILTMGSRSSTLRTSTSTVGTSRYVDARDDDDYDDDNRSNGMETFFFPLNIHFFFLLLQAESLQSVDDDDEATTPASANASSSSVLASSSKESFGVSAAQPSVHLQVHLRQLSIILWTVDSLNRTSMESQWPYASTWHDDLLLDALSVDTETSLPSHVTVQVLNVAAEWTQSAIKMSTSVRLQTITVNEFLPDSVKDPKVAKYSPFVVEPFMPVLVFSSAIPVNTIAGILLALFCVSFFASSLGNSSSNAFARARASHGRNRSVERGRDSIVQRVTRRQGAYRQPAAL